MTRNRAEAFLVAVILAIHTGLLAYSASCHSPVATEIGHLPAGISHWQYLRFDLYRVNPPLVRMVAAIPMLFADPETDWSSYNANAVMRSETPVGQDFIRANGERTFFLYKLGRWACVLFSWIGALVCWRWARDLFGTAAGLTALALWCFSPNVLGHGALMMPDVPSAALGVATCFTFWHWLRQPTWWRALVVGLVLGLAELTKTTLLIFYPLWPVLWLVYRWPDSRGIPFREWFRQAGMLAFAIVTSVYVINMGYAFEGIGQRLGEYRFVTHTLGGEKSDGEFSGNRFANTWLASLPVLLPKNYVQGIDAQKHDFERGMRSYLRGEWNGRGWWYFYLYGLAIKVPLGTLTLVAIGTATALLWRTISWRDEMLILVPLAALLILVSSQTGFSIHFRYILPAFPFIFICASRAALWLTASDRGQTGCLTYGARLAVVGALGWSIASSLWHYPHSLSYFNELVGGPRHGHEHMLDSNIAWGQDLLHLKQWYDDHPEARPLNLAMYTLVDPRLAGIEFQKPDRPKPGWYVIDANALHGSHDKGNDFTFFQQFEPVDRIGYSLYVYHVANNQVTKTQD